jgi:hypothetical protein
MTKDEKVIKEIIAKYGDKIDLKKNPHVILEIIRNFGSHLGGVAAECLPPGGPPARGAKNE